MIDNGQKTRGSGFEAGGDHLPKARQVGHPQSWRRIGGPAVIFQHVVPFSREHESRRRRSRAKVEIGRNDFQGADLSRRRLHGSDLEIERTVQF
jgi:hypothetical protein